MAASTAQLLPCNHGHFGPSGCVEAFAGAVRAVTLGGRRADARQGGSSCCSALVKCLIAAPTALLCNPFVPARYEILRTCIAELQQAGIITDATPLAPFSDAACPAEPAEGGSGGGGENVAANGSGSGGDVGGWCSMDAEGEQTQQLCVPLR